MTPSAATRPSRFFVNEMPSWLDNKSRHNLAESTAGEMSFEELLELVGRDVLRELRLGYAASAGMPALRDAIARRCGVPSKFVLTTQGAAHGLFLLAFELCRPGDEVVLAMPCFSPTRDALDRCGASLRPISQHFDEGYCLDLDRLAEAMTHSTRLISIASPHNPSGVCVPESDVRLILSAMSSRAPDALLFVDESYRVASYGDASPPASVASLDRRVITGSSLSKAHAAPGLRCGWLTVPCESLFERLTMAKVNMVISGSTLDEALAAALLRRADEVLSPTSRKLARAIDIVSAWHSREAARLNWVRPQAGAMCCMRLRRDVFDQAAVERFWETLPSHDLRLAPGTWFGDERRVFRLGFGSPTEDELEAALMELSVVLDEITGPVSGRSISGFSAANAASPP